MFEGSSGYLVVSWSAVVRSLCVPLRSPNLAGRQTGTTTDHTGM